MGGSLSEPDKVDLAKDALAKAKAKGVRFLLPVDTLTTDALDFDAKSLGEIKVVEGDIPDGWEGVDIGPENCGIVFFGSCECSNCALERTHGGL